MLSLKWFYLFIVALALPFIDFGAFGRPILFVFFLWIIGVAGLYQRNSYIIKLFSLVFILCVVQAISFFILGKIEFKYVSRGLSTSLNSIIWILFSIRVSEIYGRKSLDYLVCGFMMAYLVLIITAIPQFGIEGVSQNVFSFFYGGFTSGGGDECEKYLEQSHSFLLIAPFFALFYFYNYLREYNRKDCLIFIGLIFMSLLAYKRIAIGAACIVSGLFLIKRIYCKKIIYITGLITIIFLLLYISMIRSGGIYIMAERYDVNLMFRDVLWPEFEHLYSFNVLFEGQGWGFVSKFLHDNNVKLVGVNIGGLHNDILKVYIDLGFIGFIIYFGFFLLWIPIKLLNKFGLEASFYWWIIYIYIIFIYLTDNAMIYESCQILIYSLILSKIKNSNLSNESNSIVS